MTPTRSCPHCGTTYRLGVDVHFCRLLPDEALDRHLAPARGGVAFTVTCVVLTLIWAGIIAYLFL